MSIDLELELRSPAVREDNQAPSMFGQTPSQTVGPFFHYGLPWMGGADLVGKSDMGARPELFPKSHNVLRHSAPTGTPGGEPIEIVGRVIDGQGQAIGDVLIEIWQANAAGRYASMADKREELSIDPNFIGFGRASTDADGVYRFRTVYPGRVPGPGNSLQASHLAVSVFGRGILKRLITRIYFEGGDGNDEDAILALVPEDRRRTLIAHRREDGAWQKDIILQGDNETVFFDF